ncbi:hypothetical protein GCM10017562_46180 [Streptomyces roseofulvus]
MASLGRVTCFWHVVGPRSSARDRTAGDSSPVTQKGRSVPGTPGADRNRLSLPHRSAPSPRPVPSDFPPPMRRDPPAPLRSAPPLP